jgi:hypothetical protein
MKKSKLYLAIKGGGRRSLHCGLTEDSLLLDAKIIAGFGSATIKKDGGLFYFAPYNLKWEDAKELSEFEEIAKKTPSMTGDTSLICRCVLPFTSGTEMINGF